MKYAIVLAVLALAACASKPKADPAMLEKYPQCYHNNAKIAIKCIQKNEAGDATTAVQLENTAYPGQYE